MAPLVLFNVQFVLSLIAYGLIGAWYVAPRLAPLPREDALAPLVWVHVFRIGGGAILAPGSVDAGVPQVFRAMIGYGDMGIAVLAMIAVVALRRHSALSIPLTWLFVVAGLIDTVNAMIQSTRFDVFTYPLGTNWLIVAMYVPALLVSSVMIIRRLMRP